MNSRIKDLANQATQDIMGVPTLDPEYFAQLVALDCAGIVYNNLSDEEDGERISGLILEVFGVDNE
jgi:hypothetical protein